MKEVSLIEQFVTLARTLKHRHYHGRGAVNVAHHGQGRILALLAMEEEMTQKKLAYILGIRPQSVGEMLAKLEQNEYVTRQPMQGDRRSLAVRLTAKGQEAAQEQTRGEKADDVFQCLSEEERKNFSEYLSRIIASLPQAECSKRDCTEHHCHKHSEHSGHRRR